MLGEQMLASYPVVPGENTVLVQTPLNAAIGFTMSRIRLSTAGGLESDWSWGSVVKLRIT